MLYVTKCDGFWTFCGANLYSMAVGSMCRTGICLLALNFYSIRRAYTSNSNSNIQYRKGHIVTLTGAHAFLRWSLHIYLCAGHGRAQTRCLFTIFWVHYSNINSFSDHIRSLTENCRKIIQTLNGHVKDTIKLNEWIENWTNANVMEIEQFQQLLSIWRPSIATVSLYVWH